MDSIDSSDESEKDSWIDRFLSLDGHEFLCEVDTEFIQDSFNLYGLKDKMGNTKFKHALKTILDHYDTTASDSDDPDFNHARELYGLIHQRFILTRRGLDKMVRERSGFCMLLKHKRNAYTCHSFSYSCLETHIYNIYNTKLKTSINHFILFPFFCFLFSLFLYHSHHPQHYSFENIDKVISACVPSLPATILKCYL